jgi:hypothetical protein
MGLSAVQKKKIPIKSLLLHELAYIPNWQKHNVMMEDPMEGIPAEPMEVFRIFERERSKIDEVLELLSQKKYVIKLITGTYYTTPVENLELLRRQRRDVATGHLGNKK